MNVDITSPENRVDPVYDIATNQAGDDGQISNIFAYTSNRYKYSEDGCADERNDGKLDSHV